MKKKKMKKKKLKKKKMEKNKYGSFLFSLVRNESINK